MAKSMSARFTSAVKKEYSTKFKGRVISEEARAKTSATLKGHKVLETTRAKISARQETPVISNLGVRYQSQKHAATALGVSPSAINLAIRKARPCKGLLFTKVEK
jgi:hypothetical protein